MRNRTPRFVNKRMDPELAPPVLLLMKKSRRYVGQRAYSNSPDWMIAWREEYGMGSPQDPQKKNETKTKKMANGNDKKTEKSAKQKQRRHGRNKARIDTSSKGGAKEKERHALIKNQTKIISHDKKTSFKSRHELKKGFVKRKAHAF